jgi:hypothetical protein
VTLTRKRPTRMSDTRIIETPYRHFCQTCRIEIGRTSHPARENAPADHLQQVQAADARRSGGVNTSELASVLRHSYVDESKPWAGLYAEEVTSPCGTRRADALWLPTSNTSQNRLIGHEIKVSRSDLLVELRDPTKADPWAQYCDRWWLVVPDQKLLDGLDVPEFWGVLAPPSGRLRRAMTVVKPAPDLNPMNKANAFARLVAWQYHDTRQRTAEAVWKANRTSEELDRLRAEIRSGEAQRHAREDPNLPRVMAVLEQLRRMKRENHVWESDPEPDVIARIIVDHMQTTRLVEEMRRSVKHIAKGLRDPLESVNHTLAEIAKKAEIDLNSAVPMEVSA